MFTRSLFTVCVLLLSVNQIKGCSPRISRMSTMFTQFTERVSKEMFDPKPLDYIRINAPGQRFTATHGVSLPKGGYRNFVFVVDRSDANYMAISSNVALRGIKGGPDYFEIYMRYGKPPTTKYYDQKTTVTASDSYIGEILYSRDITVRNPKKGNYYLLLVAKKSFNELLITSILDTPPDLSEPQFKIHRMGEHS